MVFYFISNVVAPQAVIYMGIDKHENEDLIKYGWPEDVWFHVDKLSSAHVYLRLKPGETLEDMPSQLMDDCAQLVKANSIQGNKMNNIKVVFTMWENLKKTGEMDIGQVGFNDNKAVRLWTVDKRINEVVNRLNKTKTEKTIDEFKTEREERDKRVLADKKAEVRAQRKQEEDAAKQREEDKKLKSYDSLFANTERTTNKDDGNDSDDFM